MNVYRWSLMVGIIFSYFSNSLVAHAVCTPDSNLGFQISSSGCTGEAVTFTITGSLDSNYNYYFKVDGTALAIGVSSFNFPAAGEKSIILVKEHKTNPDDCFTNEKKITVSVPPTITFNISNTSAQCSGNTISFAPTFIGVADYNLLWEFGDNKTSTETNPTHKFEAKGGSQKSFTVTLTATHKVSTCKRSVSQTINVKEIPDIKLVDVDGFEIESFKNCENGNSINPNFIVSFKDLSTANISYSIDWGDGTSPTSGAKTTSLISHTYLLLGIYEIAFTANGANGCSDTKKYTVYNISNPAIGASLPAGTQDCSPFEVSFSIVNTDQNDPSTTYLVDVGDGTPPTTLNHPLPSTISHTYTKTSCGQPNNSFVFSIEARNGCDNSTVTLGPIKIFRPPTADVDGPSPALVCVNTSVTFQNKSLDGASNNCSVAATYDWDFGDGTILTGITNKSNQAHSYTLEGNYIVKLKAGNSKCGFTEDTFQISVCGGTSISSFNASFNSTLVSANTSSTTPTLLDLSAACAPLTVNLNNTSTEKCNFTYQWSVINASSSSYAFGGGGITSTLKNPNTITFSQGGSYTVKLLTTNICGTTESFVKVIINLPPSGTPVVSANASYCVGQEILASSSTISEATSYVWTIAGISGTANPTVGIPLNSQSLSAFQLPAGSYKLSVIAANSCGSVTGFKNIVVNPIPTVQISPSSDKVVCLNEPLELTATTTGTGYQWMKDNVNIGGATGSKFTVNTTTTVNSGTYKLAMTQLGCTGFSAPIIVTIKDQPTVSISSPSAKAFCKEADVSATLNATPSLAGTYNFNWLRDNVTIVGANTSSLSVTQSGSYTVSITDGVCSVSSTAYVITVFPASAVQISPSAAVLCEGQTITVTASGATTYGWSPSTGLSSTTGSTIQANPSVTTDYTLVATNSNNCQQTIPYRITVNPKPAVTISTSENDLCFDTSATLTAIGASTYVWSPSLGLTTTTAAQVTAKPNLTTTYTVTGTSAAGCQNSSTFELKVRPKLPAAITSSTSSFCTVGDVTATLSTPEQAGLTYQWTLNNSDIPSANSFKYDATALGIYQVKVSDDKCNIVSPAYELKLFQLLPLTISPSTPTICRGESITVTASGSQTYSWVTGASSVSGNSISTSPSNSVDYKLSSIDANGCTDQLDFKIVVNDVPVVLAKAFDTVLCLGDTTKLTASGAVDYSWAPTAGLSSTNTAITIAKPTTSTTYQVTGTNVFNCKATASVAITVLGLPNLSAGDDVTYCNNFGEVLLMANNGLNPLSGTWSGDGVTSNKFEPNLAGPGPHNLTYTVTDNTTGCVNKDVIVVTVKEPPNVNFQIPENLCRDESLTIVNTTAAFTGNTFIYNWDFGNGNSSIAKDPTVTYTSIGEFNIKLKVSTSPDFCSNEITKLIKVRDLPVVIAAADKNQICFGESTTLTATGGDTYQWTPINGLSSVTSAVTNAKPLTTTSYVVTGANTFGCKSSATVNVTVLALPNLSAGADVTYCVNYGPVALLKNTGLNPLNGVWSGLGVADDKFDPQLAGVGAHTLTYTVKDGVTECVNSDFIVITVKDPPQLNFQIPERICKDATLSIINTTPDFAGNALSFTWDFGNGGSSTNKNPSIAYANAGDYLIKMSASTKPDNCFADFSKSIQVIDPPTALFGKSVDKNTLCGPITIGFDNKSTGTDLSHTWNFDNGKTSSLFNPEPIEFVPNPFSDTTYVVSLKVISAEKTCAPAEYKESITINPNPTANFLFTQNPICADYPLPLNNFSFGKPLLFRWDFGDGSALVEKTRTGTIEHVFRNNGIKDTVYQVSLVAINDCGQSLLTRAITVTPNKVDAFYEAEGVLGCEPFSVAFKSNQIPSTKNEIIWEWGDGTFTYGEIKPTHMFEKDGFFSPKLIVRNGCNIDTCSVNSAPSCGVTIEVKDNPSPLFVANNPVCFGQDVIIENKTIGQIISTWNFGDGTVKDDLQSPTHSYSAVGTYPIEHRVTYTNGCEASYTLPVEVLSLPVPSFNIGEVICEGRNFSAQNTSSNAQSFLWRIDLLNSPAYSTSINLATNVPNYGNYRLNLFAFTEAGQLGCTDSTSQVISVGRVPELDFDFSTIRRCDSTFVYVTNNSSFPSPNDGLYAWDIDEIEVSSEFEPDEIIFKYSQNEDAEIQIKLESTSVNGCSNSLAKPLLVPAFNEQIFVPDQILCFIPNDPNNGFFKLRTETVLKEGFSMNIYGQWGNEVYKTDHRDAAWDGFYLGQVAPLGNYLANVKYRGCSTKNYYELRVPLCLIGSSN